MYGPASGAPAAEEAAKQAWLARQGQATGGVVPTGGVQQPAPKFILTFYFVIFRKPSSEKFNIFRREI